MAHIAVERNRRRQMNEHLKLLRSLTPRFYIERGDQASIIGGVIEFIKELHLLLQALESKKQRRLSLSPRSHASATVSSPSPSPRPMLQLMPSAAANDHFNNHRNPFPSSSTSGFGDVKYETPPTTTLLGSCCNSAVADVEAKLSGSNVELKVISRRVPGQVVRMVSVLEMLSFEVLHLNISSMDDTVLYSFLLKIGLECEVSMEELAVEVHRTFFSPPSPSTAAAGGGGGGGGGNHHRDIYPNQLLCL
ncbi:unnamed protein product [Linum tenue]|uniref:BHLH domain-containing protein n=1 Tax=Linum tenue TaxID=586396 RepID=A0AAV0P745_9ROSI|nr:unnamed protein product [Linum tenue]